MVRVRVIVMVKVKVRVRVRVRVRVHFFGISSKPLAPTLAPLRSWSGIVVRGLS